MTTLESTRCRPQQQRQFFRMVLTIGIERHHRAVAIALGVAHAGLGRAPGAEIQRAGRCTVAPAARAQGGGVVGTRIVDDEDVAAERAGYAADDVATVGDSLRAGITASNGRSQIFRDKCRYSL